MEERTKGLLYSRLVSAEKALLEQLGLAELMMDKDIYDIILPSLHIGVPPLPLIVLDRQVDAFLRGAKKTSEKIQEKEKELLEMALRVEAARKLLWENIFKVSENSKLPDDYDWWAKEGPPLRLNNEYLWSKVLKHTNKGPWDLAWRKQSNPSGWLFPVGVLLKEEGDLLLAEADWRAANKL